MANAQMQLYFAIGEPISPNKLDFNALFDAYSKRIAVESSMLRQKMVAEDCIKLLSKDLRSVHVKASERRSESYLYKTGENIVDFGEDMLEFDFRHPGTSYESDDEDRGCDDEAFSLINTKADCAALLFASAAAAEPTAMLHSTYKLQMTVRVDDKRLALNFDCFEYKPSAMDPTVDQPTQRSLDRFDSLIDGEPFFESDDEDDDEEEELGEDIAYDQPMHALIFQATAGDFLARRLLRFRVPMSSIVGARLARPQAGWGEDPTCEGERHAVLVLEFSRPPDATAFAARKNSTPFTTVPDWTPNQVCMPRCVREKERVCVRERERESVCVCV